MIQLMCLLGLTGDRGCDGDLEGASPELAVVWRDFLFLPAACVDLVVGTVCTPD